MAKDSAYWFPHDYEPTADVKMQALIGEHGGFGYGIFWRVTEMLHSERDHKLPLKPYLYLAIAKQMSTSVEQVEAVLNFAIYTCELFITDGSFFWSERVNRNLEDRAIISQKRSLAGKRSAFVKQMRTNVANKSTNCNTGQDRTGQDITIQESSHLWNSIFTDQQFMAEMSRMNPGKDLKKAWDECFNHFIQLPTPLLEWEWRQKYSSWLNRMEVKNGTPKNRAKLH